MTVLTFRKVKFDSALECVGLTEPENEFLILEKKFGVLIIYYNKWVFLFSDKFSLHKMRRRSLKN